MPRKAKDAAPPLIVHVPDKARPALEVGAKSQGITPNKFVVDLALEALHGKAHRDVNMASLADRVTDMDARLTKVQRAMNNYGKAVGSLVESVQLLNDNVVALKQDGEFVHYRDIDIARGAIEAFDAYLQCQKVGEGALTAEEAAKRAKRLDELWDAFWDEDPESSDSPLHDFLVQCAEYPLELFPEETGEAAEVVELPARSG